MERHFSGTKIFLIVYTLIFALFFTITFGKYGNPLIDTGREFYTPFAMLKFNVALYKDIICIYGPLPYILNYVFMALTGTTSIPLFNVIGGVIAYLFGLGFFFLAKEFFSTLNSSLITLAVLMICIFSTFQIFNFIIPYSYAMTYSALFSVFAILSGVKYFKTENVRFFALSMFLTSLAICSKLDCAILILPIIFLYFLKKPSKANLLRSLILFVIPFAFALFYFIVFKVSINDIIQNFKFISSMGKSPSLHYFYSYFSGFTPNFSRFIQIIPELFFSLIFLLLPLVFYICINICNRRKNRPAAIFLTPCAVLFTIIVALIFFSKAEDSYVLYCYLPLLFAFIFICDLIQIFKGKRKFSAEDFLVFSCLIFSIKVIFCLIVNVYGVFYLPFMVLISALVLKTKLKITGVYYPVMKKYFAGVLILFSLISAISCVRTYTNKSVGMLETPQGKIAVNSADKQIYSELLARLVIRNIKGYSILGLPEGLFFNYVLGSDYKLYPTSFTPMDFDAYGEDYMIEKVQEINPEAIFLTPRDTGDYGKHRICVDYGQKFCREIFKNYYFDSRIGAKNSPVEFTIFIRKMP